MSSFLSKFLMKALSSESRQPLDETENPGPQDAESSGITIPTYRVEGDFDGRCHCDLNPMNYVELTASPRDLPKDDSRPVLYLDLVEVVGGHAKKPNGGVRYDNYILLNKNEQLRLFHHTTNRHDKNAIAVFSGRIRIFEDDILGYVPRDRNNEVLAAFARGFLIEAYISHIKEWYRDRDTDEKRPLYDANMVIKGFPKADAHFEDILYSRCHLSLKSIKILFSTGLNSQDSLCSATDQQLLAVDGIGPVLLQRIRTHYPRR